ncbi:MAG: hypothetical protein IT305_21575 [Chloroflexi bacterium]|nr:hypothetical protein [Chloroflexota bacterium]
MCFPVDLDVPVLTIDCVSIGTAREIVCACPHGDADADFTEVRTVAPTPHRAAPDLDDLWLVVDTDQRRPLYVPFGAIAETRLDAVRLRVSIVELAGRAWDRIPAGLPSNRAHAA